MSKESWIEEQEAKELKEAEDADVAFDNARKEMKDV